jgi:2-polyprenyl-3-methyl-5-hydroxy-6-metoxy-1,4-benzoquinol methylase
LNPLSKYWLNLRQSRARKFIHSSSVLDVGSRNEKITPDALSVDLNRKARADVCASVEFLPFRDKQFDCVSYLELLEHLERDHLERALDEAARVSRFLVMSTPNTASHSWNLVWYLWSRTIGREWMGAHKFNLTKELTEEILEKHGFEITDRNFTRWSLLIRAEAKMTPKAAQQLPIQASLPH